MVYKVSAYLKKSVNLIEHQSLAYSVAYNLYYDSNQFEKAINAIKKVDPFFLFGLALSLMGFTYSFIKLSTL